MSVLAPVRRMPKRTNDVSVKIDAEAARIAKIVAAYRDQSLAEYLSAMVLAKAKQDLAEEQVRNPVSSEAKPKGGKR